MTEGAGAPDAAARSTPKTFEQLPNVQKFLLLTLMTFLSSVAVSWFVSPSSEAGKRGLARANMPILTGAYRLGRRPRMPITVVTVDDADLSALGLSWPLPMDYYGRLIRKLASHQPQAIFLDVAFLDDKPDEEVSSLTRVACQLAAQKKPIPVYIASFAAAGVVSSTESKLLAAKTRPYWAPPPSRQPGVEEAPKPPPDVNCLTRVAAHVNVDEYDRTMWEYPLYSEKKEGHDFTFVPSPAIALACQGDDMDSDAKDILCWWDRLPAGQHKARREMLTMAVTWPFDPPTINEDFSFRPSEEKTTEPPSSSPPHPAFAPSCRATTSFADYLPYVAYLVYKVRDSNWLMESGHFRHTGMGEWFERVGMMPCPYTAVIPARVLDGANISREELASHLDHSFLLIGTSFQSSGDMVYTPVQGSLPGVHGHAIALDNLLNYRGWYRRGGSDFEFSNMGSPVGKFTLFLLLLASTLTSAWHVWFKRKAPAHPIRQAAPFDTLFDGHVASRPSRSLFKIMKNGGARAWVMVKILVLHFFTLGYLPAPRNGRKWLAMVLRGVLIVMSAWAMMYAVCLLGDVVFRVGPLSYIEYMFVPAILELFDRGERLSVLVVAAWGAGRYVHSAQHFREAMSRHDL